MGFKEAENSGRGFDGEKERGRKTGGGRCGGREGEREGERRQRVSKREREGGRGWERKGPSCC